MNINIKKLVLKCKTKNKLDAKKIKKAASFLNRAQLRLFLMMLREERKKELVTIETPVSRKVLIKNTKLTASLKKKLGKQDIEFVENKELLGGIIIRVEDRILDLSFKGALDRIYDYYRQSN